MFLICTPSTTLYHPETKMNPRCGAISENRFVTAADAAASVRGFRVPKKGSKKGRYPRQDRPFRLETPNHHERSFLLWTV